MASAVPKPDDRRMAAAPEVGVHAFPLASPELALVDAHLAAELRQCLRLVEDSRVPPRPTSEHAELDRPLGPAAETE